METYLIITEKPSVQRKFAKYLLEKIEKIIRVGKAKIYIGRRKNKRLIIVSLAGHVINLDYPESSANNWKYPEFLPENKLRWVVLPGKGDYLKALYFVKNKFKIDYIVVATDVDREGSWLAAEVLEKVFGIKPPYRHPKVKRMYFSAITKSEIVRAFENLGEFDYTRALAGRARAIIDLQVGANITRALTIATGLKLVSSGRVQGPTLHELYKREIEIEKWKEKKYYEITVTVDINGKILTLTSKKKFEKREDAQKYLEKLKSPYITVEIREQVYTKKPLPPFNITELQAEAFRLFKLTPAQTKAIAQRLYEAGLLSYPRTSATKWNKKYKTISYFKNVILKACKPFLPDIVRKIEKNMRWPPVEGKLEDEAHPPIHPVGFAPNLPKKYLLIYELVVRRTLATLMPDAKIKRYIITAKIDDLELSTEKEEIVDLGWLEVYGKYLNIPRTKYPFKPGKYRVLIIKKKIVERKVPPPPRYTPSSIIKWMEKMGLGTRATRDQILEKLYDRYYIIGKRQIKVTDLGKAVIEALKIYCPKIIDPKFTAELDKKLEMVEKGLLDYRQVINEYLEKFKKILEEFKKKEEQIGRFIIERIKDRKLWSKIVKR